MSTATGTRIRKLRIEVGISQKEAARRAGITPSLLSQIENSRTNISISTLEKIATALNLPMTAFISGEPHLNQPKFEHVLEDPKDTGAARQDYNPVLRPGSRPMLKIAGEETSLELLSGRVNSHIGAYILTLQNEETYDQSVEHEFHEQLVYLNSGELKVELDSGTYLLQAGYAVHVDQNNRLNKITGLSADGPAVFLLISYPPVY